MRCVHLLIQGKVQGVFYRVSTKETADKLNITGTVRNTNDGNVEIVAVGNNKNINEFIEWCKHGPPRANVSDVEVTDTPLQQSTSFNIIK
jgi:acylphosphatase